MASLAQRRVGSSRCCMRLPGQGPVRAVTRVKGDPMSEFITQHTFWTAVAAYWVFSAAVGALPAPVAGSKFVYRWMYRFLHTLAGNVAIVLGGRIPGAKALIAAL